MKKLLFIILIVISSIVEKSQAQIITTIAGTGASGYSGDGGQATSAKFALLNGLTFDTAGSLYIVDGQYSCVRKVNMAGIITTIAGNGTMGFSGDGGQATAAELSDPTLLAFDATGNLYIADRANSLIRKVTTSGIISTVAGNGTLGYSGDGGQATLAALNAPTGIALDVFGNFYIADDQNSRIRKVNSAGIISTIAGNGTMGYSGDGGQATAAELSDPWGITFDAAGNLYITDAGASVIRKVNTAGIISTVVGTGTGGYSGDGGQATAAEINQPVGVILDAAGNLYFADNQNSRVRVINTSGIISTIVGNGTAGYSGDGGLATSAKINRPWGIIFDSVGNLYIADEGNNVVRKVTNVGNMNIKQQKENKLSVSIYPNPTSNTISINFENISNSQNATITIQNVLGEEVKKLSFTKILDVSNLAEGCYFLQVTLQNGENFKTKFIKQ